jgi:hypothetical protein
MPDKQDFSPATLSTEDRVDRTVGAGTAWVPALKNVPQQIYLFGLIPLSLLGVFSYLLLTGSMTERWIGLIAIVGIIVLCLVFAFILSRGIDEGTKRGVAAIGESHEIIPKQKSEIENGVRIKYEYDLYVSAPMASRPFFRSPVAVTL